MANSIYDGDFNNNFQSYRNKQRLAGGQIDPRVVGSLAEADLNSRYADQRSRRSQDLQEKSINNQYALGQAGLAQSSANSAQNYDFLKKQLSAQKSSAGIGNMGSIANILMSGVGLGNKMGLWGAQPKESTTDQYLKYLMGKDAKGSLSSVPSIYNDTPQVGSNDYNYDAGLWDLNYSSVPSVSDVAPTDYGTSGGDYWEELANSFADYFA